MEKNLLTSDVNKFFSTKEKPSHGRTLKKTSDDRYTRKSCDGGVGHCKIPQPSNACEIGGATANIPGGRFADNADSDQDNLDNADNDYLAGVDCE